MIYQTDLVTIEGSNKFLGGFVYAVNYEQGFNGNPSNLEVSLINENRVYQIPTLNYSTTYHIKLGNTLNLNLYAYKYCITNGEAGKILNVSFVDGVNRLKRYWIGLKSFYPTPVSNVIRLGKTVDDLIALGLPKNQFDHYSYAEFQTATAFLGIPAIPSNDYMTTNLQGTVLSVFNYFMEAYGYSWYLDVSGNIQLIDIKQPIVLNQDVIDNLEANTHKISTTDCSDISHNIARGAIAVEQKDTESFVLSSATPFWAGNFLKVPFKITDLDSCIAATLGKELYFAFMVFKYGWLQALEAIGYKISEIIPFSDDKSWAVKTDLQNSKNSIYNSKDVTDPEEDLAVVVYQQFPRTDIVEFDIAVRIGELLRTKPYYISNSFSDLDVKWDSGNSQLLDRDAKIAEAIDFAELLDFSKITAFNVEAGGTKTIFNTRLRDIIGGDIYIIRFQDGDPSIVPKKYIPYGTASSEFIALGETPSTLIGIGADRIPDLVGIGDYPPNTIPIGLGDGLGDFIGGLFADDTDAEKLALQAAFIKAQTLMPVETEFSAAGIDNEKYSDTSYKVAIINKYNVDKFSFYLPNFTASDRSVKGIGTLKSAIANSIYNVDTKVVVGKNIPLVDALTSEIEIVDFENLSTIFVDPAQYLAQAAFKRTQTDRIFTCEIRGISLDIPITPSDGLQSISISFDSSQGFKTSYNLSTIQAKIVSEDAFRQKFPIN